jgi:D-amino peptidase
MKVFISADMEGIACVSAREEVTLGTPEYAAAQEQMTAEVAAACQGAFEAGAREIWVKDAHWTGRNLDPRRLPCPKGKTLRLIRGWSGHPFSMVQELDSTFTTALFVGYHSAASRGGNPLAHTLSSRVLAQVTLNERVASECLIFGYAASSVNVPVGLVCGDEGLCEEVKGWEPSIRTVATFKGVGPSIVSLLPAEAVERIHENARDAVGASDRRPLALPAHFQIRLTFRDPAEAFRRSFYPGAKLGSDTEIAFETKTYFEILRLLKFMTMG